MSPGMEFSVPPRGRSQASLPFQVRKFKEVRAVKKEAPAEQTARPERLGLGDPEFAALTGC